MSEKPLSVLDDYTIHAHIERAVAATQRGEWNDYRIGESPWDRGAIRPDVFSTRSKIAVTRF